MLEYPNDVRVLQESKRILALGGRESAAQERSHPDDLADMGTLVEFGGLRRRHGSPGPADDGDLLDLLEFADFLHSAEDIFRSVLGRDVETVFVFFRTSVSAEIDAPHRVAVFRKIFADAVILVLDVKNVLGVGQTVYEQYILVAPAGGTVKFRKVQFLAIVFPCQIDHFAIVLHKTVSFQVFR